MQTDENIKILDLYAKSAMYFYALSQYDSMYIETAEKRNNDFFGPNDQVKEDAEIKKIRRTMMRGYSDVCLGIRDYLHGVIPNYIADGLCDGYSGFYAILRELNTVTSKATPSPTKEVVTTDEFTVLSSGKIEWLGTPSEFAYLMQQLAYKGYINNPVQKDGEFNFAAYHRQIIQHFTLSSGKESSVLTYLKNSSLGVDNVFGNTVDKLPQKK